MPDSSVHKLWLAGSSPQLASVHFYLHQLATLVLTGGLVLMFGGGVPEATLAPALGASAVGVLAAVLLMGWMILRSPRGQMPPMHP